MKLVNILRDPNIEGGGGAADDPNKKLEALQADLAATKKASEDYKKDMLKYKDLVDQLSAAQEKAAKEQAAKAEKQAAEDGNFKSLYETTVKDRDEIRKQMDQFRDGFIKAKKLEAVRTAALKRGFHADQVDLLEMMPMPQVVPQYVVENGAAKVNVVGVEEFVMSLEQTRPVLFRKETSPGVDDATPSPAGAQVNSEKITPEQLEELRTKDPAKYQKIYAAMLASAK